MKKILLLTFMFVFLYASFQALAQERTVSGKVTSEEDGETLPGVNVVVKGTTLGTVTDFEGNYTLTVPSDATAIIFSFIGLTSQEIRIGSRTVIDVQMAPDVTQLTEVVVTAVGIERQKKSLGYATQDIDTEELTRASNPNVLTSLSGKVAGVQITGTSGAPGSSSRIVIRGATSFTGNNQPLFVIDGIPIDNSQIADQDRRSGADFGNSINDINPDDVASVNVLKGPAAAALYGSRAANGAIIITTKSGKGAAKRGRKAEVTVNSSITFEEILKIPDFQTTYSGGNAGTYARRSFNAWGERIQGQTVLNELQNFPDQPDSVPLRAFNAYEDFYETGRTITNNISISGGNETSHYRLSVSDLDQEGIAPNTDFSRNTFTARGGTKISNNITSDFSVTYTRSGSDNIPLQGQNRSFVRQFLWNPPNVDWTVFRDYINPDGTSNNYTTFWENPYWTLNQNTISTQRNRINGFVSVGYQPLEWLNVTARAGTDFYDDVREVRTAINTQGTPQAAYFRAENFIRELTTDLIVTINKEINQDFSVNAIFGHNIRQRDTRSLTGNAVGLVIPNFYNFSNAQSTTTTVDLNTQRRLWGIYGSVSLSYRDFAFIEFTGRNDKSSTLPEDENSFFYPSITGSLVLTEAFPSLQNNILSFAKLRANWAEVGNDAPVYQLQSVFVQGGAFNSLFPNLIFPFNNQPGFSVGNRIGNDQLSPEFTRSWEVGAELSFLEDRLTLDFSYYSQRSEDQIFNVNISPATGFTSQTLNAGNIENTGIELQLKGSPVYLQNGFKWTVGLNFAKVNSEVKGLFEDLESLAVPPAGFTSTQIQARPGFAYPVIVGRKFDRAPDGRLIIDPRDGRPILGTELEVVGEPQPDWIGGVLNTFEYKGINLSVLVDIRKGGEVYSLTEAHLRNNGISEETLFGREGLVVDGVIDNGDGTFTENTIPISAETFWQDGGLFANAERGLFDASFIKLREVSLTYSLPQSLISKTPFGNVQIGAVGRNLLIDTKTPNIDPEVNLFGNTNAQGYEYAQQPSTRSYGFNLRFTF